MKRQVGRLTVEWTQGEVEKFTVPIVLVHGLWSDETAWRSFSGYLTHRGWTCVAVRLRGRDGAGIEDVDEHLSDLRSVISSMPSPPVIVGHDLGALLALHLAGHAAAVVGLAPLVPAPLGDLRILPAGGGWLASWRGGSIARPRGPIHGAYIPHDPEKRESESTLRQIRERPWPPPPTTRPVPILIVTGGQDPITDRGAALRLAEHVKAESDVDPGGGHALLSEPGWEERVSRIHRWLVKRLGVDLLALYEESEQE